MEHLEVSKIFDLERWMTVTLSKCLDLILFIFSKLCACVLKAGIHVVGMTTDVFLLQPTLFPNFPLKHDEDQEANIFKTIR